MGVYTYTQVRTFFIIDRETPGFDYDAAKIPLIFGFSFVAAQVPAYLLLMRLPMIRVMPFLSAIHGTLLAMRFLVAVKFVDFRLWTTLMGVSIGLILPQLVVYTWAWFPPNRVGVCMFTWAVFGPQLATMVSKITGVVAKGTFGIIMRLLTGCLIGPSIFYFLSLHGSDAMGLPTEVPWLDSPSKLHYAQGAALGKVSSRQLNDNTIINKTLQVRDSMLLCISAPLSCLLISPLTTDLVAPSFVETYCKGCALLWFRHCQRVCHHNGAIGRPECGYYMDSAAGCSNLSYPSPSEALE